MSDLLALGPETTEAEFQQAVDECAQQPGGTARMVALLEERAPLYAGRGTRQLTRMRGYILASMGRHGTPERALPFVLEELENGREAYLVAAAARAVRGLDRPPPAIVPYLESARGNIRLHDDALTFEHYQTSGRQARFTTACDEIEQSLRYLQEKSSAAAGCCDLPVARAAASGNRPMEGALHQAQATDQDGERLRLGDYFRGRISVVAFFYTRCENPNKCSLTVSRLAKLQQRVRAAPWGEQVQLSAFTYDPAFDSPPLLKTYGANRGFAFSASDRFVCVDREHWSSVSDAFELGVSYAGSVVSRHRIEIYVLNERGRVVASFQRLRWDESEVLEVIVRHVARLRAPRALRLARRLCSAAASLGLSLLIALFPKCPLCWAAYLGSLGVVGANAIPFQPWLLPVLVLMLIVQFYALVRRAGARRGKLALCVGMAGTASLLTGRALDVFAFFVAGTVLVSLASALVALPPTWSLSRSRRSLVRPG